MKIRSILIALVIITASSTYVLAQKTYTFDKYHSKLVFSAKHFGISNVEGAFKKFDVKLDSKKEDFSDAVVEMTAETNSIDTDVEMRDKDLRSADWFNVEKYPSMIFKSTAFTKISENNYILTGNITIRGITKPITFNVTYNGTVLNPMSKKYIIGFTITGKLNRKDFLVGTEAFDVAVGNEIELRSNVEFVMN